MIKSTYTYYIINKDNLTGEQFKNSKLSNLNTARVSSDDKLLIYTDKPSDSCYNGITPYTYTEILEELKKDNWSYMDESLAKAISDNT